MSKSEKYLDHLVTCGMHVSGRSGDEVTFDCPTCLKERHAHYNVPKELWHCKYCDEHGNRWKLLDLLIMENEEPENSNWLKQLAVSRQLPVAAFKGWGIACDGGRYLIPIRKAQGGLTDVRQYKIGQKIMSAPGALTGLFGVDKLASLELDTADIYLCEGEWDTIATAYLLRCACVPGVAVGVPGAGTFKQWWCEFFSRRRVFLLYDNDAPGLKGMKKAARMLEGYAKTVERYCWPDSAPVGADLNDLVSEGARQ